MTRYVLGVLAYLGPTFALGYLWHLVLFQSYYEALAFHGGGSRAVRPGQPWRGETAPHSVAMTTVEGPHHAMDVVNSVVIDRPRAEVSQYASDPDNALRWYENITSVEWRTPRPLQVGSRIDFVARFPGRRLAYTYDVVEFVPGSRRSDGPTGRIWRC